MWWNVFSKYKNCIKYTRHPSNAFVIHCIKWLTPISRVLSSFHWGHIPKRPLSDLVQVLYNQCGFWSVFFTDYMGSNVVSNNINYIQCAQNPSKRILINCKKWLTNISSVASSLYQGYIQKQPLSDSAQVVYNQCEICPVSLTHRMGWYVVSNNINYMQYTKEEKKCILIHCKNWLTKMSSVLSLFCQG